MDEQIDRPLSTTTISPIGELFPAVYDMLRAIAQRMMSDERADGVLQATALVHDAYVRLVEPDPTRSMNRALFVYAVSEELRRILIDHARARDAQKRGGGGAREDVATLLDQLATPTQSTTLELEDAISALGRVSPDAAAVIRLRFYAGLSVAETAATLDCSPRSVDRLWAYARAWLFDRLGRAP